MDYDYIKYLKEHNPALKMLRMDYSPLIISFLFREYKETSRTSIANQELSRDLTDYIYYLRQLTGDQTLFRDRADNYLDKWAGEGFLRKYYTPAGDDAFFDLTPAAEKALHWISDLNKREFIGTESRLLKIFDMLKEVVYKNSSDPAKRLLELNRQKRELDEEIRKVKSGYIQQLDSTQIKERFYDIEQAARTLLSDFKEVEYNFRTLDRDVREKQIHEDLTKGKFLENIFNVQDLLWDTDQGKSFKAFWEFIMSRSKQEELDELIKAVRSMPEIQEIKKDNFIDRLKINLVEAGSKVNKTNHLLMEQLSRYLAEKSLYENKRIVELVSGIKAGALAVKNNPPQDREFIAVEGKPALNAAMNRALFTPPVRPVFEEVDTTPPDESFDAGLLYDMVYIDKDELQGYIKELLRYSSQVTLAEVIAAYPVTRGLTEVIAYMDIAEKDKKAHIGDKKEKLTIYNNETEKEMVININRIIFCK